MGSKPARQFHTHYVIASFWMDWEKENGRIAPWSSHGWDWGEPACMAGGWWKESWDTKQTIPGRWKSSGLERCHIVPRYMGGADDPSNLVLMCSNCHDGQPDSEDPEVTFAYMRERRLWDCMGISGAVTGGLLDLAAGVAFEEATDRAMDRALVALGVQGSGGRVVRKDLPKGRG